MGSKEENSKEVGLYSTKFLRENTLRMNGDINNKERKDLCFLQEKKKYRNLA